MPFAAAIPAIAALAGGAMSAISNGVQNAQNVNYQSANLDYQKALQKKIFEREDTAIQRRKRDLEEAGFNPYLAMSGNGAGAGSVVSTQPQHTSFDISPFAQSIQQAPGAYVDMLRSLEALKQDKLYTTYMKMGNLDYGNWIYGEYGYHDLENSTWKVPDLWNKGLSPSQNDFYQNSSQNWLRRSADVSNYKFEPDISRFRYLNEQYNNEIMKVKRDFAVSDKIEQYILDSISALTSGSNSARGWYDSYNKSHTPPKAQNYRESYTRNRNGYTRTRDYY